MIIGATVSTRGYSTSGAMFGQVRKEESADTTLDASPLTPENMEPTVAHISSGASSYRYGKAIEQPKTRSQVR